jgi:hypothetical protein
MTVTSGDCAVWQGKAIMRRPDGSPVATSMSNYPIFSPSDALIGFISVSTIIPDDSDTNAQPHMVEASPHVFTRVAENDVEKRCPLATTPLYDATSGDDDVVINWANQEFADEFNLG